MSMMEFLFLDWRSGGIKNKSISSLENSFFWFQNRYNIVGKSERYSKVFQMNCKFQNAFFAAFLIFTPKIPNFDFKVGRNKLLRLTWTSK